MLKNTHCWYFKGNADEKSWCVRILCERRSGLTRGLVSGHLVIQSSTRTAWMDDKTVLYFTMHLCTRAPLERTLKLIVYTYGLHLPPAVVHSVVKDPLASILNGIFSGGDTQHAPIYGVLANGFFVHGSYPHVTFGTIPRPLERVWLVVELRCDAHCISTPF